MPHQRAQKGGFINKKTRDKMIKEGTKIAEKAYKAVVGYFAKQAKPARSASSAPTRVTPARAPAKMSNDLDKMQNDESNAFYSQQMSAGSGAKGYPKKKKTTRKK